jgi:hypothetical protein
MRKEQLNSLLKKTPLHGLLRADYSDNHHVSSLKAPLNHLEASGRILSVTHQR